MHGRIDWEEIVICIGFTAVQAIMLADVLWRW